MIRSLAWVVVGALLLGCQGRGPAARPPAAPPAPEVTAPPPPPPLRVAVVDFIRAVQAHPRWGEVAALDQQIQEIQIELAMVPGVQIPSLQIPTPKIDLTPEMKAEVERMKPEFQREVQAFEDAGRKELADYGQQVRSDQLQKLSARRSELKTQLDQAIKDKQQAIATDTQQFQEQTMAEYRLPLLNLHLKQETIQTMSKTDAEALAAQIQTLTKERDEKIAAHERANQQAFFEFQKAESDKASADLKAYQDQLTQEGQRLVDERAAQITARVRAEIEAKQGEFNQRLKDREQALVAAARGQAIQQMTQAKTEAEAQARKQIQAQIDARDKQMQALRTRLLGLQRDRARLYAIIMADLRIEAAALSQEKGWDVVLTQAVASVAAVDGTDDLIARIKH